MEGFVIQLLRVSFGYPGSKVLFNGADFGITSKSRIVLLGENGNGKSTLLKILNGDLNPLSGEVRKEPSIRVAIVNQHHADQISLQQTPLQLIATTATSQWKQQWRPQQEQQQPWRQEQCAPERHC